MRQYDIIVRSEFYVPAILEELPTYIYELTDGRFVLRNGIPVMSAQKITGMEPIATILREDGVLALATTYEHINNNIILKELFPGAVLRKIMWPAEADLSTLFSQPAGVLATGILKPGEDIL